MIANPKFLQFASLSLWKCTEYESKGDTIRAFLRPLGMRPQWTTLLVSSTDDDQLADRRNV